MQIQTAPKKISCTKLIIAATIFALVSGIGIGWIGDHLYHDSTVPHIDLPEEYKNMTHSIPIQGNYDSTSNTLTIEFKP